VTLRRCPGTDRDRPVLVVIERHAGTPPHWSGL